MKIGTRVRINRGEHEGRLGTVTDFADSIENVKRTLKDSPVRQVMLRQLAIPEGCLIPVEAWSEETGPGVVVDMRRPQEIPVLDENQIRKEFGLPHRMGLLDYLSELEKTVRAAPIGRWHRPSPARYGEIVSDEGEPTEGYGGHLIAESMHGASVEYVLATQPRAALALIAKLREASELMRRALEVGGTTASQPVMAHAFNALVDEIRGWATIEVPR